MKRATKRELIVVATMISRMIGTSVFSDQMGFSVATAYAMAGDAAKSKIAYQDFLTLWKHADPDIPILKEAKAEYAKLQ